MKNSVLYFLPVPTHHTEILLVIVSVCKCVNAGPKEARKGHQISWPYRKSWATPHGDWKLNLGPLNEQEVLWTAESSLHSPYLNLKMSQRLPSMMCLQSICIRFEYIVWEFPGNYFVLSLSYSAADTYTPLENHKSRKIQAAWIIPTHYPTSSACLFFHVCVCVGVQCITLS